MGISSLRKGIVKGEHEEQVDDTPHDAWDDSEGNDDLRHERDARNPAAVNQSYERALMTNF